MNLGVRGQRSLLQQQSVVERSPDNLEMFVLGVEEVGSSKRMTIYSG
jgi:hypothetical protein